MGCNCGKRELNKMAALSDEGSVSDKRNIFRKALDFILTILLRIFTFCLVIIMGAIAIIWMAFRTLFFGDNDISPELRKILMKSHKK